MGEHELAVTRSLLGLNRLDAKRCNEVDQRFRPDAEFDDWALEIDMATESKGKLIDRISTLTSAPYKILWVLPSATRMHRVGALCHSLGERVWYTNLRYIGERWINWKGEPCEALLKPN